MDGGEAEDLDALAAAVESADATVAFTGAGISTPSGISSFRGEDGVWESAFDPADFHVSRFRSEPAEFWRDRLDLHEAMYPGDVAPNAAHEALAELEAADRLRGVITQNTDGLHGAAGSERVIELHGNAERVVCPRCGDRSPAEPVRERVRDGEVPPTCGCGGVLKPDVVLFGESLPDDAFAEACRLASAADAFLTIGSSLAVEPAASLPREVGPDAALAVVNLEETPADDRADHVFRADVTDVLPALIERVLDRERVGE